MRKIRTTLLVLTVCMFQSWLAHADHHGDEGKASFHNSPRNLEKGYPFSELVKAGNTLYLAGQLGYVPKTNKLAPGGIKGETKQAMENIKAVLTTHGFDMSHLVKCTAFLADMAEWGDFNQVYKTYFAKGKFPARSAVGVGLGAGARIEVECIGYAG